MKHIIALLTGMVAGSVALILGLYLNPFIEQQSVSPLSVTADRVVELSFSEAPGDVLLYTDHGESIIAPYPEKVAELWEPSIKDTRVWVTMLQDSRGQTAGFGIKMSSLSEQSAPLRGEALANSIWHLYLPGQGTLMIDQTENYWSYLREIVIPARWSSGDNWRGNFFGIMTNGPGSLGTARVTGGSGAFEGMISESTESLTAKAYSAATGPVSMNRSLAIAMPESKLE